MQSAEEWTTESNKAVTLSLISPKTGATMEFHPKFTYPVFGESETIFGYKELRIYIYLAEDDLSPCVDITWAEKLPRACEIEAEDVVKALKEFVPESMFHHFTCFVRMLLTRVIEAFKQSCVEFKKTIRERTQPFSPPGKLIKTYQRDLNTYEVYRTTLDDVSACALLHNMQFLVTFYIEAGTPLDLRDEEWTNKRWEVFFLYSRSACGENYIFCGYSTLYRWYYFDKMVADLARIRLSQFLILPPFQQQGHGTKFYDAIVFHYISDPTIMEITVEDPSDAFEDLRDIRDLSRLRCDPTFVEMSLENVVAGRAPLNDLRRKNKMPQRQFLRCMELELLAILDKKQKRTYQIYKLLVKRRIYRQNIDVLAQLPRLERIDKLDQTYFSVEDDYHRILDKFKTERIVEVNQGLPQYSDPSTRPLKRAKY